MNNLLSYVLSTTNFKGLRKESFFSLKSPTECYKLKILGIICLILFVLSIIFNSALLKVFIKYRTLRTPVNVPIIALTILNLIGTLIELPFVIVSNLKCRWIFDELGCKVSSVIMFWIGCASIILMAAISFQRYYIVYKPFNIKKINYKKNILILIACILYGLIWSLLPLFGWSYYTLEGSLTSCGVEWKKKSFNLNSFKIAIFIGVYLIPLIVIVYSSIMLLFKIKKTRLNTNRDSKKKEKKEKNATFAIMIAIIAFIISWTPYALVSMYLAFIDPDANISPFLITSLSILGKSCLLWSSVIYVFFNTEINLKIFAKKPKQIKLQIPNLIIYGKKTITKVDSAKEIEKILEIAL